MPRIFNVKTAVTLSFNAQVWIPFQEKCKELDLVPSHELEAFMKERLANMGLPIPRKETDHA